PGGGAAGVRRRARGHGGPPADLGKAHDAGHHVVVVSAYHDDVVCVMRDSRGEGSTPEPGTCHEADPDPAGRMVALDHCDLRKVALGVSLEPTVVETAIDDLLVREQLSWDDADDAYTGAACRYAERVRVHRRGPHRAEGPLGNPNLSPLRFPAAFQDQAWFEAVKVVQHHEVCL